MILDYLGDLARAQAVTAAAIGNVVIDRRNATNDVTAGNAMRAILTVDSAVETGGATTGMTVSIESDSTADGATAPVVHATRTIALAALATGTTFDLGVLAGPKSKRYLLCRFTPTGGNAAAGNSLNVRLLPADQIPQNLVELS